MEGAAGLGTAINAGGNNCGVVACSILMSQPPKRLCHAVKAIPLIVSPCVVAAAGRQSLPNFHCFLQTAPWPMCRLHLRPSTAQSAVPLLPDADSSASGV